MRATMLVALAALVVLSIATSVVLYEKVTTANQRATVAQTSRFDAEQRYGDALSAIAEIQDSLGTLGTGGIARPVLPGSPATERGLSVLRGREALDRIAQLKAGIGRARERLATLETTMRRDGIHIRGLERMIGNLKHTLAEKEQLAAALTAQVDSLHVQVGGLTTQVAQAQDTIQVRNQTVESQRRELGTVWYLAGSKRQLAHEGLLVARGGVLGLGRTLVATPPRPDDPRFTAVDTDAQTEIRIPAAKARVVSAQPAASYALVSEGRETVLRILDPLEFRTVRHLVIVTS